MQRAKKELEAPIRRFFQTFDLLKREPEFERQWAIVELRQRYLFREQRRERLEVPASVSIGQPPPVPEQFLDHARAHSWVERMDAKFHACTGCSFSPGEQLCAACGGSGRQITRNEFMLCTACDQTGRVTCSLCNGEQRCVWAEVSYVRDYPESYRRFYRPFQSQFSAGATALVEYLEGRDAPEALYVSLDQRRKGPYRDGPTGETDFHGFQLGVAADAARKEIARRERQRPLLREIHVLAWPVRELVYRVLGSTRRILMVSDGHGVPLLFVD